MVEILPMIFAIAMQVQGALRGENKLLAHRVQPLLPRQKVEKFLISHHAVTSFDDTAS